MHPCSAYLSLKTVSTEIDPANCLIGTTDQIAHLDLEHSGYVLFVLILLAATSREVPQVKLVH